jgi:hypothetical protein
MTRLHPGVERSDRYDPERDVIIGSLQREHVDGQRCPDCGSRVELDVSVCSVEAVCAARCGWGKEVWG